MHVYKGPELNWSKPEYFGILSIDQIYPFFTENNSYQKIIETMQESFKYSKRWKITKKYLNGYPAQSKQNMNQIKTNHLTEFFSSDKLSFKLLLCYEWSSKR